MLGLGCYSSSDSEDEKAVPPKPEPVKARAASGPGNPGSNAIVLPQVAVDASAAREAVSETAERRCEDLEPVVPPSFASLPKPKKHKRKKKRKRKKDEASTLAKTQPDAYRASDASPAPGIAHETSLVSLLPRPEQTGEVEADTGVEPTTSQGSGQTEKVSTRGTSEPEAYPDTSSQYPTTHALATVNCTSTNAALAATSGPAPLPMNAWGTPSTSSGGPASSRAPTSYGPSSYGPARPNPKTTVHGIDLSRCTDPAMAAELKRAGVKIMDVRAENLRQQSREERMREEFMKRGIAQASPEIQAAFFSGKMPTSSASATRGASRLQKRKHQIMSVANQASAFEFELAMRRAKHHKSKRETAAKYGW